MNTLPHNNKALRSRIAPSVAALCLVVESDAALSRNFDPLVNLSNGSVQELGCSEHRMPRTTGVRKLFQLGVLNERQVSQVPGQCQAFQQSAPVQTAQSRYIVDGIALGGPVNLRDSDMKYHCSPSEQFAGFIWCQNQRRKRNRVGTTTFGSAILQSYDGTAVYINRYIGPVTFGAGEIEKEIARLSSEYGEQPRIMRIPSAKLLLEYDGVIALWGNIMLEPLNSDVLSILASGKDVNSGLRIDYLGNLHKSAKIGLPIYRIEGGAGYLWSASVDADGRGHLRFLTSNAETYEGGTKSENERASKDGAGSSVKPEADTANWKGASNDNLASASNTEHNLTLAKPPIEDAKAPVLEQSSAGYLIWAAALMSLLGAGVAALWSRLRKEADYGRMRDHRRNAERDSRRRNYGRRDDHDNHVDLRPSGNAWYEILGVSVDASIEAINVAYYARVRKNHPDRVADLDPAFKVMANERTRILNAARAEGLQRQR
jgi:hypothetical protein